MRKILFALLLVSPMVFAQGLPIRNLAVWYVNEDGLFVLDNDNKLHHIDLTCPYEPEEVEEVIFSSRIFMNENDKVTLLASNTRSRCEIKSIIEDS